MATIYHQIAIKAPIARVYRALSSAEGISAWWDKQTPIQTDQGLILEHSLGPEYGVVRLKVLEVAPNKRVEWECISHHPPESPASVRTGIYFIFEISEQESVASAVVREYAASGTKDMRITTVDFRQTNHDPSSKCAGFNNYAWALVLTNLKSECEAQNNN